MTLRAFLPFFRCVAKGRLRNIGNGLNGANHDFNLGGGRITAHIFQIGRIIQKVMHWRSAVEAAEVLLHQINGLEYALFDRNGRHDDNELGKAISLVQLKMVRRYTYVLPVPVSISTVKSSSPRLSDEGSPFLS